MSRLIGWWKGEDNAVDSKSALNGTWSGAPGYTTGVVGNAFDFNGTPYITVAHNELFNFTSTDKFTIELYFKTTNVSTTQELVQKRGAWGINVSVQKIYCEFGSVAFATGTIVALENDTWGKLKVKYNAGIWTIYYDVSPYLTETLVYTSTSHLISQNTVLLSFGAIVIGATGYTKLTGSIDEIKIYNDSQEEPMVPTFQKLNLLLAKQQSALGTKAPSALTMTDQSAVDDTFSLDYVKEFQDQNLAQAIFGQVQAVGGQSFVDAKITLPIIPTGTSTLPNVARYLNCCGMAYALSTKKHSWTPSSAVSTAWKDLSLNGYTGCKDSGDSILTKAHSAMFDFEISGEVGTPVIITFTGKAVPDGIPAPATYLTDQLTPIATQTPAMLKNATQTINGIAFNILKFSLKGGCSVQLVKSMGDDSGNLQAMITDIKSSLTATVYMEDQSAKNPLTGMAAGTLATTTLKFGNATDYLISIISGTNKSEIRSAKMGNDQGLMTWDLETRFIDNNYTLAINDAT